MVEERLVRWRSLDGLLLVGTLVTPEHVSGDPVVLVHGGGVTREEGGFFGRLAAGLAEAGLPSLRFDLRGHGESEGRQEELTLAGIGNDIRSAADTVQVETGAVRISVLGASFSGGICAGFTAAWPERVGRLVLLYPLMDYKKRFIDDKPYWHADYLDSSAAGELVTRGFLAHSPTFRLGRPLLNEVFTWRPSEVLGRVAAPTLLVHGTGDTFIPVDSSRRAASQLRSAQLLEIENAQHGFAVHEDPQYSQPQTQEWQAYVIREVASWLTSPAE